jgi:hypothetical protein
MASPELTGFVFDQCQKAIQAYNDCAIDFTPELKSKIQETINSGDSATAEQLVKQYNIY